MRGGFLLYTRVISRHCVDLMINKLPKWVEIGGFFLAFTAGSVNSVGLLGFKHQAVSHLTGVSTFFSLEVAGADWWEVFHLWVVALAFLVGAIFSGFVVGNTALKLGRRYSLALAIEALLLIAAAVALFLNKPSGYFFASAACGLQNAMTSSYSGAVVRTTHVSGLFTDIGIMLGMRLRGQKIDQRRVLLYLILISGFVLGGVVGALIYQQVESMALLMPAAIALLLSICYWVFLHGRHQAL